MTARATPESLSDTGAWLCSIAEPMKNELKVTISATTRISTANTTALAASIGSRFGTASREARITPVEYSVAISSTPSTAIASWPRPVPAPSMKLTGSAMIVALRCAARGPVQLSTVSQVNSAVKPMVTTTKTMSVQIVERTERIFVHSLSSRWPKPARWAAGGRPAGKLARQALRMSSGTFLGRGYLARLGRGFLTRLVDAELKAA